MLISIPINYLSIVLTTMGDNGQNMLYIEIRNAIESVEVIVNIGTLKGKRA